MTPINTPAAATPAYSRGQASARGEVATSFLLFLKVLIFNIIHIMTK
jgi:hypothetical protein